jgi:hypothetical protein
MTNADLDRPDDLDADAERAVLELALAEHFGHARAPAVADAAVARRRQKTPFAGASELAVAGSTQPTWRRQWQFAAAMLFGAFVVVALALDRSRRDTEVPLAQDPQRTTTEDLADLQRDLAAVRTIAVRALAAWSDELQRWVPLEVHEVQTMPWPDTRPELGAELQQSLLTALALATIAADAPSATTPWTHELELRAGGRKHLLRLRLGDDDPSRLELATRSAAKLLRVPQLPRRELERVAIPTTQATLARVGIVLGASGFASVPMEATSLQLVDVPTAAIDELLRRRTVHNLDLRRAPAWHDPAVLRRIADLPLRDAWLSPLHLDADGAAAVATWRELRFLGVCASSPMALYETRVLPTAGARFDDRALQALGAAKALDQLVLAGVDVSDDGLAFLARLPLRQLHLAHCPRVRGASLARIDGLVRVSWMDMELDESVLARFAALPKLTTLFLRPRLEDPAVSLAPLANAASLEDLRIVGPLRTEDLPQLAGLERLRSLRLAPTQAPTASDLAPLAKFPALRRLGIVGLDAALRRQLQELLPKVQISDEAW